MPICDIELLLRKTSSPTHPHSPCQKKEKQNKFGHFLPDCALWLRLLLETILKCQEGSYANKWGMNNSSVAFFFFLYFPTDLFYLFIFSFIFISWRLITSQYCSGFCHTLTWICHGFTCIPHPDSPSHLPLYPIPLGLPFTTTKKKGLPWWSGG